LSESIKPWHSKIVSESRTFTVEDDMDNANNPEVLAVVPLPSAEERRRREIMLARVMLVAIDLVLSGEGMGLETARDLVREVRHAHPELVDELW
jgi:hypothetical protein